MYLTSFLFISALCSSDLISQAFPLNSQAFPTQPAIRRRIAYSVVPVDGGSDATSAAPVTDIHTLTQTSDSVKTVTASASSTPLSIETTVVTNVVSELEPEKTMFISVTQDATTSLFPTTNPFYSGINPATAPTSTLVASLTIQKFTSTLSTAESTTPANSFWTSTPTVAIPLSSSIRASEATLSPKAKHPEAPNPEVAATTSSTLPTQPPTVTQSSFLSTFSTKTYDDGRWHTSYTFRNATLTMLSSASTTAVGTGSAQNFWSKG